MQTRYEMDERCGVLDASWCTNRFPRHHEPGISVRWQELEVSELTIWQGVAAMHGELRLLKRCCVPVPEACLQTAQCAGGRH
jgi:hypothetical protein